MNEELQSRLVASMDKVEGYLQSTEAFAVEQAPLVVQEILITPWIDFSFVATIFLLLNGISYFKLIPMCKKMFEPNGLTDSNAPVILLSAAYTIIVGIISTIELFKNSHDVMTATLTPRLYILEQLTNLF